MQRWTKYIVEEVRDAEQRYASNSFAQYENDMGGYGADASYVDKNAFYNAHLSNRYATYDAFARRWLRGSDVLSVASGRGVNEMMLLDAGYDVTCSDMGIPGCYQDSQALFGKYEYLVLDITKTAPKRQFSSMLCLSSIFIFDDVRLDAAFRNMASGLKAGGRLVLDPGGPSASLRSLAYHAFFLPAEAYAYTLYHNFCVSNDEGKWHVRRKLHGFRRTQEEIVSVAKRHGLVLVEYEESDFETEFSRSIFLGTDRGQSGIISQLVRRLVGGIPYIRLFAFEKE